MSVTVEKFSELVGVCADAMPADSLPLARRCVEAYERLLKELVDAKEEAEHLHYLWGVTLSRLDRVQDDMDVASSRLKYDCLGESRAEHTEAKP